MDATEYDDQYFVFDNRLASFQGPQPVAKRRPSNAAGSRMPRALSWPHKSPAAIDLARAGFFFNPQPSNPDNVRCFLCQKDLDGWEEDDDPLQEHLKHSGSCGWAICAAIELELGEVAHEDPRLPYLLDARKSTFAGRWPYESKKGWKCKTKQLAEAGWKYTPTLESDDNTTCAYCQLALDGWEAGDKPMDEHQRRSPNCPFFTLTSKNPPPKKATARGGKAARASKVSRLSVQSVATAASDTQSLADFDDSILTSTTVLTQGGRKAASTRARKTAGASTAGTAKGRKPRAKKDGPVAVPAEPDVKDVTEGATVTAEAPAPAKPGRGKKRNTQEVEPADDNAVEAPAPKRRATRVRASNNSVQADNNDYAMFNPTPPDIDEAAIEAELRALEQDMEVDQQLQQQLEQEQELQVPKKGRKTGTRKVSKQTRKTKEPMAQPVEPETRAAEALLHPAPAPEPEIQEPESSAPVHIPAPVPEAKPKAKSRAKPKKLSQERQSLQAQPQQQTHDIEEVDELHEDSIISIASNNTVVRGPVEQPQPAPAPAKKRRGRPPKQSSDSVRSSAGTTSQNATAHAASAAHVPAKITPIPPPSIPGMATSIDIPAPAKRSSLVKSAPAPVPSEPTKMQTDKALPPLPKQKQKRESRLPAPATPRKQLSPIMLAKQAALSPSQSPQSSDAENQPPSARPTTASAKGKRFALAPLQRPLAADVAADAATATPRAAVSTPVRTGSPSKRSNNTLGGLRSTLAWSAMDVDTIFEINKEHDGGEEDILESLLRKGTDLNTPEKAMTVEEFIFHNASQAERMLKQDCEAMVSTFEQQGTRAMRVLESLEVEE